MKDLAEIQALRAKAVAACDAITNKVKAEKRSKLTTAETTSFRRLKDRIADLDFEAEEYERSGRGNPDAIAVAWASNGRQSNSWAARAADAIWKANGEKRAITASSIDIPTLVQPNVVPMNRPGRLVDLLVDRQTVESNSYEYWRQTTRTNNADVVADAATKPTSVFTVTPIEDRCRVIAHLSEPVPNRLFFDHQELRSWLDSELREGLLDALEAQVVSGSGTGEDMVGLLTVAGTTAVNFATDVSTTLRKAVTALQNIGVQPNGWVLNPADAEAIDLTKEGTGGVGFLLDGYQNGNAMSNNVFGPNTPRVVSPSIPAGTALLADFSKCRIYVREDIRIDLDPFTEFATNRTIVRAEMRVGFAVLRPDSFAEVDLTA